MNKIKLVLVLIGSLLVLGLAFYAYNAYSNSPPNIYSPAYELTEDKLITNQTMIDMIVNDLRSPLGNNLTKVVIDEDDPQIMDESWKIGYYVCDKGENKAWIYYSAGESPLRTGLYGPYEWCLI